MHPHSKPLQNQGVLFSLYITMCTDNAMVIQQADIFCLTVTEDIFLALLVNI